MIRLLHHYIIRELRIPISWLTAAAHRSIVLYIHSLWSIGSYFKSKGCLQLPGNGSERDSPEAIFGHIMRAYRSPRGIKQNGLHGSFQALNKPASWKDTPASTQTLCDHTALPSHWMSIPRQSKRFFHAIPRPKLTGTITVLPKSSLHPFHVPQVARATSIT